MLKKSGLLLVGITALIFGLWFHIQFAIKAANDSPTADFAAFYMAANVILDPEVSSSAIYDYEFMSITHSKYGVDVIPAPYVYSVFTAYALAPLALIPYNKAKIVWSLNNLLLYIASVLIVFLLTKPFQPKICYLLILSMLWIPFIFNQYWLQSNAILLFIITLAILTINKKRPYLGGVLLGFATLIKLFPFAIPMVLAFKNPRILFASTAIFGASLFLPGALGWLSSIKIQYPNYTTIYLWLSQFGQIWFVVYAITIAVITAMVAYRNSDHDYPLLAALAIPAALLISPVVGGYYLVLLMFSFVFLLEYSKKNKWLSVLVVTSFAWINLTMLFFDSYLGGLFFFWASTILYFIGNQKVETKLI